MTPVFQSLYHAVEMVERVTARLEHEGAALELDQLAGLSVDELDLLVRLERYDTERPARRAGKKTTEAGYYDAPQVQSQRPRIAASGPENSQVASGTVDGMDDREDAA